MSDKSENSWLTYDEENNADVFSYFNVENLPPLLGTSHIPPAPLHQYRPLNDRYVLECKDQDECNFINSVECIDPVEPLITKNIEDTIKNTLCPIKERSPKYLHRLNCPDIESYDHPSILAPIEDENDLEFFSNKHLQSISMFHELANRYCPKFIFSVRQKHFDSNELDVSFSTLTFDTYIDIIYTLRSPQFEYDLEFVVARISKHDHTLLATYYSMSGNGKWSVPSTDRIDCFVHLQSSGFYPNKNSDIFKETDKYLKSFDCKLVYQDIDHYNDIISQYNGEEAIKEVINQEVIEEEDEKEEEEEEEENDKTSSSSNDKLSLAILQVTKAIRKSLSKPGKKLIFFCVDL